MKEFNEFGSLIFEGDYSEGEREKGKEYSEVNGDLLFKGEYSDGKRNGKGEEFYYNGKILFKGEYKNGKRWNGKEYKNDVIEFEIEEGKRYKIMSTLDN